MYKNAANILVCSLFIGLVGLFAHHFKELQRSEPDVYTQLSLARQTSESGLVRTIPQVRDLGWDTEYIDKNFLFTQLTGVSYKLFGETGVFVLGYCMGVVFTLLLVSILTQYLTLIPAVLLVVICVSTSPIISARLAILSPQSLSAGLFLLVVYGLVSGNSWQLAVGAFLFALSTQALYLFVPILVLYFWFFRKERSTLPRKFGFIFGATAIGVLVNPYFPNNLFSTAFYYKYLLNSSTPTSIDQTLGMMPFTAFSLAANLGGLLLIFGGAFVLLAGKLWAPIGQVLQKITINPYPACAFLGASAGIFLLLTAINPTGILYSTALVLLFAANVLSRLGKPYLSRFRIAYLIPILALSAATHWEKPKILWDVPNILTNLERIPRGGNKKVFHCDSRTGNLMLYYRPDLSFIDLGDEYVLYQAAPLKSQLRTAFNLGLLPYPFGVMKRVFHADYHFCLDERLAELLKTDPYFTREVRDLASQSEFHPFTVLPLREGTIPNFITDFEIAPRKAGKHTFQWMRQVHNNLPKEDWSPYLGLTDYRGLLVDPNSTKNEDYCFVVRPHPDQYAAHLGSEYLGIGGGRGIQILFNGRQIFRAENFIRPQLLKTLIKLPRKLRGGDTLMALVCSPWNGRFIGFAASFWSEGRLKELCPEGFGAESKCFAKLTKN